MKPKIKASSADIALVRRLLAAGCPMPANERQEKPCDLTVEVTNPEITTAQARRAGTEYVFAVRIRNVSYQPLTVQGIRIRMPWVARLIWLGDPARHSCEPMYRFASGRKFPYREVINHRIGEQGELAPGESLEGLLLAYTMFDGVGDFIHRECVPASIFVIDQFGRKHRSEIEITVDRSATMRPFVPNPNRKSLFEERHAESSKVEKKKAGLDDDKVRVVRVQ